MPHTKQIAVPRSRLGLAFALLAAALLTGCYGSTEPASKIGLDHATLNGKGTTDNGAAHVYFEYWQTAFPSHVAHSLGQDIPAGATGPYAEENSPFHNGLAAATTYAFRLCGLDAGARQATCANTRLFRTVTPSGDAVAGFHSDFGPFGPGTYNELDAHSDAAGTHPGGFLALQGNPAAPSDPASFSGTITCLAVSGHHAVAGGVGTTGDGRAASGVIEIADTGADPFAGADRFREAVRAGSTPPSCAAPGLSGSFVTGANEDFTVYDTP